MQPFSSGIQRFLWVVQHSLFSPALSPVTPVTSPLLALPSPDSSPLSHLTLLCPSRDCPGARPGVLVTQNRRALCRRESEPKELRGGLLGAGFQLQHQGSTAGHSSTGRVSSACLQRRRLFFLLLSCKCGASQLGGERLENTLVFTLISLYICIDVSRYTHRCINIYVCLSYIYTYMHTPASHSRILLLERRM